MKRKALNLHTTIGLLLFVGAGLLVVKLLTGWP